jgi:hypothetical protein
MPNKAAKHSDQKSLDFETFVRAAMQTGKAPKPAKKAKKRRAKK